jgi:hypothetical protein
VTLTAETRLSGLGGALMQWCRDQTYSSPQWIYGWSRTDFPDRYRFTVTMGYAPIAEHEVTEDTLEEKSIQDLCHELDWQLLPHTLTPRNDEL